MQTTLASDLLFLAVSSYKLGKAKTAAKLFAKACSLDLPNTINIKDVDFNKVSNRVLAQLEQELEEGRFLTIKELQDAVKRIKAHANADVSLDMENIDEEPCPVCNQEQCICDEEVPEDFDTDGIDKSEVKIEESSSILKDVKNALVRLKIDNKDWQVKKYLPILITLFPNVIKTTTDRDVAYLVNVILNNLKTMDHNELKKLHSAISPLLEQ